jgi:hypothetical protein
MEMSMPKKVSIKHEVIKFLLQEQENLAFFGGCRHRFIRFICKG